MKNCKQDLLELLPDRSHLPDGLGGSGSCSTGAASVSQAQYTTARNKVDREFERFALVAKPRPGVPPGWCMKSWVRHLRYMADACEQLHPDNAAGFRRRAQNLIDDASDDGLEHE